MYVSLTLMATLMWQSCPGYISLSCIEKCRTSRLRENTRTLSLTLERFPKGRQSNFTPPFHFPLSYLCRCSYQLLIAHNAKGKMMEDFPDFSLYLCVRGSVSVCAMCLETKTPAVGSPVGKACGRKMWARRRVIMSAWEIRRVILHNHTSKKTVGGGRRRRQHVICLLWYKIAPRERLETSECVCLCVWVHVCVCALQECP